MFTNCYSFNVAKDRDNMEMKRGIPFSLMNLSNQTADLCYEGDVRKRHSEVKLLQYSYKSNITILSINSRARVSSCATYSIHTLQNLILGLAQMDQDSYIK